MGNLFIVHFQPIEKYPPVINLLRYLASHNGEQTKIHVITTGDEKGKQIDIPNVAIQRLVKLTNTMSRWRRLKLYIQFNIFAFQALRKWLPQKVMYFETLSAAAPFFYKRWINKKSEIFIHYHEYTSNQGYRDGMMLQHFFHQLELKLYPYATWVSHTNEDRLRLFLKDSGANQPPHAYVLPNYPPASWKEKRNTHRSGTPGQIAFVYVGALGLETMYIREFSNFVKDNTAQCSWHIYSDNYSKEVIEYFENLHASNIDFKGAVDYDELPSILGDYDIGVILYNGHIPNYIYNAPNKLFEYLACGLDVWFPDVMKGCKGYITTNTYPEVRSMDFNNLNSSILQSVGRHQQHERKDSGYYSETILFNLKKKLLPDA